MKKNRWGTLSLAVAFAGWAGLRFQPWWGPNDPSFAHLPNLFHILEALFSSALVGSVTDWFAVTALFKKPLGLPLPHVDVLRRRKNEVAKAVPRFLSELLTSETIGPELAKIDYVRALEAGLVHLRRRVDAGETASRLIGYALGAGWDQKLWTAGAGVLQTSLQKNRLTLAEYLTALIKKNAGWQGFFVGSGTVEKILVGVQNELDAFRLNTKHPLREFLRNALGLYALELIDPTSLRRRELQETLQAWEKDPELRRSWLKLLGQVLHLGRSAQEKSETEKKDESELRSSINRSLGALVTKAIARTKALPRAAEALGDFLSKVDPDIFVTQVEKAVWNDLQYIRVNGAIVGGLAGVALALLSSW